MNVERDTAAAQMQQRSCKYKPLYDEKNSDPDSNDCSCAPVFDLTPCHCTGLSNRWSKESLAKRRRHPKRRGLVGYLRSSGGGPTIDEQRKIIRDFCSDNEYYIRAIFSDEGRPGMGLQAATAALQDADGLIASDLNRFVVNEEDRLRDLRPFVHHFFCHPAKHLITVEEGVDTGSVSGQANAITAMNRPKESY